MMAMESYRREQQALQQQQQQDQLGQTLSSDQAMASNALTTTNAPSGSSQPQQQQATTAGEESTAPNTQTASGDADGPPSELPVQMMIKPGVSFMSSLEMSVVCHNGTNDQTKRSFCSHQISFFQSICLSFDSIIYML